MAESLPQMSPPAGSWALIQLPFPMLVTADCFGRQIPARVGPIDACVVLPTLHRFEAGGAAVVGWDVEEWRWASEELDHWDWWGQMWHSNDFRCGTVHRALLVPNDGVVIDKDVVSATSNALRQWLTLLTGWVGAISDQDTASKSGTVFAAQDMVSFHFDADGMHHVHKAGHAETLYVDLAATVEVLDIDDLLFCAGRADAGKPAPLERVLLAQARNAFARHRWRQAVLDAGSACELVLYRHVELLLTGVHPDLAGKLIRRATLGRLVDLSDIVVNTPGLTLQQDLVALRNKVAHKGIEPTRQETRTLLTVAEALINHLSPIVR